MGNPAPWLSANASNGVLAAHSVTNVIVSLNDAASNLPVGSNSTTVNFTNQTSSFVHRRNFALAIHDPLVIVPEAGFSSIGPVGGPFSVTLQTYTLSNSSLASMDWAVSNEADWVDVSTNGGTLSPGQAVPVTVSLNVAASNLALGSYAWAEEWSDLTSGVVREQMFNIQTGLLPIANGGFELGNFQGWSQTGSALGCLVTSDATFVHSGSFGAELGPRGALGYLTQTVPTKPGKVYLISFWLENQFADANEWHVSWNGSSVYDIVNGGVSGWTNIQILVAGEGTNSVLQFAFRNDYSYFGLDDVAVFEAGLSGSPPAITVQPTNETVTAGWAALFTAAADGIQPIYYQWQHESTNLPGATDASLVISPATTSDAGSYSLLVSNQFGVTNSSNAVLTVNIPVCTPPAAGLLGWWAGEGSAADSFGTNSGALMNWTGFADGDVGQAFQLNGINQYVQVPDNPGWNFGTNGFTIELWAKFSSVNATQVLVAHDTGNFKVNKWNFWLNNGVLQMEMYDTNFGETFVGSGAFNPVLNEWYHLAVTRSGALFSFYVDGVLNSSASNNVSVPVANAPLTIGASEGLFFLAGEEDEISIYNRGLTAAEIQAIHNAGSTGKCPPPLAIKQQPSNQTVTVGNDVAFGVGAIGTAPFFYQWQLNGSNISVLSNATATNAILVLPGVQLSQSGGLYSVIVSNGDGFTNSSNALLTVNPPPPCLPPPTGLVAWWAGDGNALDSFGTNDGTLMNGAGFANGKVRQAFQLNGVNQYVQALDSASWNFGTNDFTIELWAKFSAVGGPRVLVAHDTGKFTVNKWNFWLNNGRLQMEMYDTAVGETFIGSGTFSPVTNQWYHLAMTRNGALFSIYVNGVLSSSTNSAVSVPVASAPLTIGSSEGLNYLAGEEDEISIYSRGLSQSEIQAIYNAGTGGKCLTHAPIIAAGPGSLSVPVGTNAVFSVLAGGARPLTYQWLLNGTNIISSATNATLVLTNVQTNVSGDNYSVFITNAYGTTNSSNALLTVIVPACTPPASGLVGWWSAEGSALDSYGTNDGVLLNGAGYTNGEAGQAFNLDGVSQYVQVPDSPNWNFGANGFTIELWTKFNSVGGTQVLVAHDTGKFNQNKWNFWLNNGALQLEMYDTAAGDTIVGTGAFFPVSGQWYHLAVTRNGTLFSFYINGILRSSSVNSVTVPVATAPLTFGSSEGLFYMAGEEDEISIYNRGLGASDIQAIFSAGSYGKCGSPPLIAIQPQNQVAIPGGSVSFQVSAKGAPPLTYQWQLNGSNISAMSNVTATNATLLLTNLQLNQSGGLYSVIVSNYLGVTNSSNAMLTVNLLPPCVTPPLGLAGWWAGEGNALDSSGTNDGILVNGAGFGGGEVGQAFLLDGASQYVQVPDSSSWNFGTSNFTIELWAKFAATGGTRVLAGHDTGPGTVNKWLLWLNNGVLQMEMYDTAVGETFVGSGAFSPATNQWYHLAVTRNGTLFSFYVNGVLNSSVNNSVSVPARPPDPRAPGQDALHPGRRGGGLDRRSRSSAATATWRTGPWPASCATRSATPSGKAPRTSCASTSAGPCAASRPIWPSSPGSSRRSRPRSGHKVLAGASTPSPRRWPTPAAPPPTSRTRPTTWRCSRAAGSPSCWPTRPKERCWWKRRPGPSNATATPARRPWPGASPAAGWPRRPAAASPTPTARSSTCSNRSSATDRSSASDLAA